jgi:hypothetical protein
MGEGMNIAVVRTTDIDEARRAMERVFLPMAIWPLEPLTALDMRPRFSPRGARTET